MSIRRIVIVPLALFVAGLSFAGSSLAGDKQKMPHLVNCSENKVLVCAYNGDDSAGVVASWSTVVNEGQRVQPKCDGHGKKRCRIAMMTSGGGATCLKAANKGGHSADFKTTYKIMRGSDGPYYLEETDGNAKTCK
jgi:hypothetical protein